MSKIKLHSLLLLVGLVLFSCGKEDPVVTVDTGFLHGAFICNEGAYSNSNGSMSYFDIDSAKMINHVFESVNGRALGDVVQSFAIAGDKGFIVVNNSQKVEIVDMKTFASVGVINGLEYPRYFLPVNEKKGYLTDGNFSGRVYVVDLATLAITDTIPCGSGPEKMLIYENTVLVANSGGWGTDSTLTVIDISTDKVKETWEVGMNPADMVLDRNNQIWVLCKGKTVWNPDFTIAEETSSSLMQLDPKTHMLKKTALIGYVGDFYWPQRMSINKNRDKIYYLESGGVYMEGIDGTGSAIQPVVPGYLYGFGIDPSSDLIYTLHAPSFTTAGWMFRYQPNGTKIDSLEVGIGPSQIVFN